MTTQTYIDISVDTCDVYDDGNITSFVMVDDTTVKMTESFYNGIERHSGGIIDTMNLEV